MANLEHILELNNKYKNSYGQLEKILLDILEKGEISQDDIKDMENSFEQETEDYNKLNAAQTKYQDKNFQEQLDDLKNNKLDMNIDTVVDLLTNGGRSTALSVGADGTIILNGASLEELNQVRLTIDEQKKRIDGVIADTEVEQADGTKVKLKVLYSTLSQTVDGIETNVGTIEGVANDANSKAEAAITKASQLKQTVDGIKSTVTSTTTVVNGSIKETYNEFYLSDSNTSATGGTWSTTAPAPQAGKYIWLRDVYVTNKGDKTYGNPVCITGAKGDKGDRGLQGIQGERGEQGVPGKDGDGRTSYFHIKYSSVSNPTSSYQMSETPDVYIGTYVDFDPSDSTDPTRYTWYRFQGLQGEKGEQGIPGVGTDGKTSYLHIKYSDDGGQTFTSYNGETVGTYIGTYTDFNPTDSHNVSSYTWAKIKGDQGAEGIGVKQVQILYYVHYSKTSAPSTSATGWASSIPAYQEGKYLWQTNKITYTDNSIAFTTPVYISSWEANHKAETAISIATQTSEKFEWLVKKGSTQSSLTLTDATIEAIANSDIKLKAKNISLEGIITANGSFRILEDGRAEIDSLSVDKEISTDVLTINTINNSRYQQVLDDDINITIYQSWPNSEEFEEGSNYQSFHEFADACPKNLNGYTVYIRLLSNLNENVDLTKFHSGIINIDLNNKTLFGNLNIYSPTLEVEFKEDSSGIIMPNYGIEGDSGNYAIYANNTSLRLNDVTVYAPKNGTGNKSGIEIVSFAKARINNVTFVNCYNAVRAFTCSNVYVTNTKGLTSDYAFISSSNSVIGFGTATNCGGSGGKNTHTTTNGRIYATGSKFSTASVSGDNISSTGSTTTKTVTITANYGDTYRKTVYNSWKRDGTVRQGDYGYGDCVGCWFFGNKLSDYARKNISKITITFTRQSGGNYGDVTHGVRTHNYTSRPSGTPSFRSDFSKSVSISVGSSGVITLTSSTDIANFMNAKGIGLVPASQDKAHYSVCSGTCKIKITYTE